MIKKVFILFFTCACIPPILGQAQVNIIQTIANVDTGAGYNGDNIPATAAGLYYPEAVCFDKSGNLLIADVGNNRIRKIDAITSIITTIAGRDTGGYSGDGGPATNAGLWVPTDVFVDTAGNIYIADILDNRVRKVNCLTGIITTLAGNGNAGYSGDNGLAINAELNEPSGIFVKKNGDVFIADYLNNVVRKIDGSTGIITTFAGNGNAGYSGDNGPATNAEFDGSQKVCCDDSGNVYISDQWNSVVRKVNAATGNITTFAGNGNAGYSGDNGPAINAELDRPAGLSFDNQNNLYVTEFGNGIVRRVDGSTGIISTVAGTGAWGYSGDGGPATSAKMIPYDAIFDNSGNMIIADYNNQCIRKVYKWPLGISNQNVSNAINIYPNPTTAICTIHMPGITGTYDVAIYDLLGEKVSQYLINSNQGEIDLSRQPVGTYFAYINSGSQCTVRKIVKD